MTLDVNDIPSPAPSAADKVDSREQVQHVEPLGSGLSSTSTTSGSVGFGNLEPEGKYVVHFESGRIFAGPFASVDDIPPDLLRHDSGYRVRNGLGLLLERRFERGPLPVRPASPSIIKGGGAPTIPLDDGEFVEWLLESHSGAFAATPANLALAGGVALAGWQDRALEIGLEKPHDLQGACKFASLFVKLCFGGAVNGSAEHQFNIVGGHLIDLVGPAAGVTHRHDRQFFGRSDLVESMRSCVPRVLAWYDYFCAEAAPLGEHLHSYTFDVRLDATFSIRASSREEGEQLLRDALMVELVRTSFARGKLAIGDRQATRGAEIPTPDFGT